MATTIKAKKDLYNNGKCFTKGNEYQVKRDINTTASLMDIEVVNDLGEKHIIGAWWRDFEIVDENGEEQLYMVYRVYRDSARKQVIQRDLTRDEAKELVNSFPDSDKSMVCFTAQE